MSKNKRKSSNSEILSAADEQIFNEAMRDVKLSKTKLIFPRIKTETLAPVSDKTVHSTPIAKRVKNRKKLSFLEAGKSGGIDHKTMNKLKRGQISPDIRLDLHGMTLGQAHSAVSSFVLGAAAKDTRCLLIITGKGRISEGGGVLRNQLPQWLNLPNIRFHVIGFCTAQPRDGGEGAFYVLLRRKRFFKG